MLARTILVCFVMASATPAGAQPAGSRADILFREGRNLMAAGKIAEACAAFEQSQKLDPAVTTLINLAACREKSGQLATAWKLFLEAERQTRSTGDDTSVQLRKIALDRATKLEARVPRLTIHVPDQSRRNQLEILLDKERVPEEMWNHALPIDGGSHTIEVRAPNAKEWMTDIVLTLEADIKTVAIPRLQDAEPSLAAADIGANDHRRWAAWKPWTVVAGGGAIIAGSGVLHVLAYGSFKSFDDQFQRLDCWLDIQVCTIDQVPESLNSKLAQARQQQIIAVLGYIIGGSVIAAGGALVYLNRRSSGTHAASGSRRGSVTVAPIRSDDMFGILASVNY